jgi:hypothetical protein
MKSIEWIQMLMEQKKLPSHRQAALMIGMTEQLMSKHRNGKALTLDDKYAFNLEKALDLPHGTIVMDQHAEREKDPAVRSMWERMGKIAAQTVAGVAVIVCALTIDAKRLNAQGVFYNNNSLINIHYAHFRARILAAWSRLRTLLFRSCNQWISKNFSSSLA